jgi:hypothetical protein
VRNNALTGRHVRDESLGSKDIRNLKGSDIKDGTLLAGDFAPGQLPSAPQCPVGPAGADATVLWAYVKADGTLSTSRGAVSSSRSSLPSPGPGDYGVLLDRNLPLGRRISPSWLRCFAEVGLGRVTGAR